MKQEQLTELLYQALETEKGGIQVYTTAIRCAQNEDLKEEWEKYLEQTAEPRADLCETCAQPSGSIRRRRRPAARSCGTSGSRWSRRWRWRCKSGPPEAAELVAAECVVHAETKDHLNWELIGQAIEKLSGAQKKALEGSARGGRGAGGRAPLPHDRAGLASSGSSRSACRPSCRRPRRRRTSRPPSAPPARSRRGRRCCRQVGGARGNGLSSQRGHSHINYDGCSPTMIGSRARARPTGTRGESPPGWGPRPGCARVPSDTLVRPARVKRPPERAPNGDAPEAQRTQSNGRTFSDEAVRGAANAHRRWSVSAPLTEYALELLQELDDRLLVGRAQRPEAPDDLARLAAVALGHAAGVRRADVIAPA